MSSDSLKMKPARRLTNDYSNVSLFDDESAKIKLKGLSIAQLLSTQFEDKELDILKPDSNDDIKQHSVSESMTCNCCQIQFTDRTEQIAHYRCDWHRYNLHQRLKGLNCVSEDDFEMVSGDISSISGSDTDSDNDRDLKFESMSLSNASQAEEEEASRYESRAVRFVKIFFKNDEGELLSLYKCLFSHKKEAVKSSSEILSVASQLVSQPRWAVLMTSSGHFAAAVFNGNTVVQHKTFHRYTVRAKRGSAQSSRDSQGNAPKSAGATLRRYNEAALNQEVNELLASWQSDLNSCSLIFVRIPVGNRGMFYGGKNPVFMKDDLRIRVIPFPTRRPTFSEIRRVQKMLSSIECYGQEADIEDFIPMSPPRFYCKDKDQLEIRPANPVSHRDKPHKKEKQKKDPKANEEEEVEEVSDDEFDINPVGPGNPLEEFEINVEKKKRRRKPKTGKTKTSSTTTDRLEDPEVTEMKNNLFTACKTGNIGDFENSIINLKRHFSQKTKSSDGDCDKTDLKTESGCQSETVSPDVGTNMDQDKTESGCQSESVPPDTGTNMDQNNDNTERTSVTRSKVCEILNCPIGDNENTLLHFVCQDNQHTIIPILLEEGADPVIKNKNGKVPYLIGSNECKNAFRRFMALFPERYDYKLAQIPSPLTSEMEAAKKQKNAERRTVKKKSMAERNKVKKAEGAKVREEEELKDRFVKLSDREKRALAAERRMLQQFDDSASPRPVLSRCFQCGSDITGKVPFEYSDFKFCTTKCLREHRANTKS